jgi:hypothetical protein
MFRSRVARIALVLLVLAGCRNNRSELVEAELRTKDRELRECRGDLFQSATMNQALENTLRAQQCSQPGQPVVRPPASGYLSQIKDIQLGRGTGVDEEKAGQGVTIVLVPRDADDSPIKAAGTLTVNAIEINPEGLKRPLSSWDVTALQLRRSWKAGLFSTGYFVELPWQTPPSTEKLRIVATFRPLDGGTFEAEKDVLIKLPPEAIRVLPSAPTAGIGPPVGLGPPTPVTGGPALPNLPVGPTPRPAPTESKRWQPAPPVELGRPDDVR